MNWRAAVAAVTVTGALVAPSASAAEPAALADATFFLRSATGVGYLVSVTVRQRLLGDAVLSMFTEVQRCTQNMDCTTVSEQVDELAATSFSMRANLTARLATRWAGAPLIVEWRAGGFPLLASQGELYTAQHGDRAESVVDYRLLNARAVAHLVGSRTTCSDKTARTAQGRLGTALRWTTTTMPRATELSELRPGHLRCAY